MKRKFKTSWSAGNSSDKEKNYLPSETVPDQALGMREILSRFASGLTPEIQRQPEYSEDLPDLRGLDISELHEWRAQAKQDVKDIQEELKRRKETPTPSPTPPVEPPKTEES